MESRDDQRRGAGNPAPATTYIILSRSGAGYLGSYRNIKNELRGGTKEWRKLTKEERQKFGSMHLENIRRIIRGLSRDGCIDLFSLLGGEEPDTANWNSRRQDASEWLKESLDEEQLNYLAFSTVHTFHPDALPRIVEKIVRTKARNPP